MKVAIVFMAAVCAAQPGPPAGESRLPEVRAKMGQAIKSLPDYLCLETTERLRRFPCEREAAPARHGGTGGRSRRGQRDVLLARPQHVCRRRPGEGAARRVGWHGWLCVADDRRSARAHDAVSLCRAPEPRPASHSALGFHPAQRRRRLGGGRRTALGTGRLEGSIWPTRRPCYWCDCRRAPPSSRRASRLSRPRAPSTTLSCASARATCCCLVPWRTWWRKRAAP